MKGLRNRMHIADDDVDDSISPLGQINLHITDGVSSHEKTPDDELAEIDRALKLEALAAKRLELELQKEKNHRTRQELQLLRAAPVSKTTIPSGEKKSEEDDDSDGSIKSGAIALARSTTIIKYRERDLLAHTLDDSDPKPSFEWLKRITVYINHGGRQNALGFLSPERLIAFNDFLEDSTGETTNCDVRYETMVYTKASDCPFIQDYISFIVEENDLKPSDYLDHCAMAPTNVFNAPKIKNYILNMRVTISMFDHLRVKPSLQIKKLVAGLQPFTFRNFIVREYKDIFSGSWADAVESITEAYKTEQLQVRNAARGFGSISRTVQKTPDKPSPDKGGNRPHDKDGNFRGKKQVDKEISHDKSGKSDGRSGLRCGNCKGNDHTIAQCEYECTRCVPSCGEKPSKCPVYLKYRAVLSSSKDEREKQITRAYKSNNAQSSVSSTSAKRAAPKVHHKFKSAISSNTFSGIRPKRRVSWATTPAEAITTSCQSSPDELLIDFGCNGNFLNSKAIFDTESFVTTSNTKVHLLDSSGVNGGGVGIFCGQTAFYLPNFDKSLPCSEVCTDQNCAVLYLKDRMYVFKLDTQRVTQKWSIFYHGRHHQGYFFFSHNTHNSQPYSCYYTQPTTPRQHLILYDQA